jgi:hypothetical protein
MSRKQALKTVLLVSITIVVFMVAFLYEFNPSRRPITHETHRAGFWLFYAVMALSYIPCWILGHARINPLFGFIPPVVINGIFWLLLTMRFRQAEMEIPSLVSGFEYLAGGIVLFSGIFGILAASLSSRIADSFSLGPKGEAEDEDDGEEEEEESLKDGGEERKSEEPASPPQPGGDGLKDEAQEKEKNSGEASSPPAPQSAP